MSSTTLVNWAFFPSLVLVAIDCCCTEWRVFSNGVAVETWKKWCAYPLSRAFEEMDGEYKAACMNATMLLGVAEFSFKALA